MQAPVPECSESSEDDEVDNDPSLAECKNDSSSETLFSWDIATCEDRGSIDTPALFEVSICY